MYRCGGSNNAMVFSMPYDGESPVDCTLSLGTPATRLTGDYDRVNHERRSSANWSANFCWDILQPSPSQKPVHGGGNGGTAVAEPLLARRCANCDTTSTPLWRNGPRGPKVGFPVIRFYIFF
ncbi:putative transcription factor C2C2-GATA family [Helianthus anomalus]